MRRSEIFGHLLLGLAFRRPRTLSRRHSSVAKRSVASSPTLNGLEHFPIGNTKPFTNCVFEKVSTRNHRNRSPPLIRHHLAKLLSLHQDLRLAFRHHPSHTPLARPLSLQIPPFNRWRELRLARRASPCGDASLWHVLPPAPLTRLGPCANPPELGERVAPKMLRGKPKTKRLP